MDHRILNPDPSPGEPEKTDPLRIFLGVCVGVLTAVVFGLGGFALVYNNVFNQMGVVLFILVPFVTGFATALVTRRLEILFASLIIAVLFCTGILLVLGLEGGVCVLMSLPLISAGLTVGALLGLLVRYIIREWRQERLAKFATLAVLPFFLIGADWVEKSQFSPRVETITNSFVTDASREKAWEQLKTFDRIEGTKGFLMTIGLPVPVSCSMTGDGVGATRTCYFEQGHIEERVTEWNPPGSMKFEITTFDVPGRPWLSFKDAGYELTTENGRTVITRRTTIVSRLAPAWYWRPLEKIGVETEHEYLFEEVKRKIEKVK
ncbi:MAG TPA: hypothetical protein VFZ22_16370 [Pyrinomonadaceae bacterium]|nr:hypothetical protein [Pyrinomonadaceae bacterium]